MNQTLFEQVLDVILKQTGLQFLGVNSANKLSLVCKSFNQIVFHNLNFDILNLVKEKIGVSTITKALEPIIYNSWKKSDIDPSFSKFFAKNFLVMLKDIPGAFVKTFDDYGVVSDDFVYKIVQANFKTCLIAHNILFVRQPYLLTSNFWLYQNIQTMLDDDHFVDETCKSLFGHIVFEEDFSKIYEPKEQSLLQKDNEQVKFLLTDFAALFFRGCPFINGTWNFYVENLFSIFPANQKTNDYEHDYEQAKKKRKF